MMSHSMELENQAATGARQSSLICCICGDVARGMNFDVITCMSCKAFFRRHASQPIIKLQCPLDNNCDITKRSRGGCSACRLQKCFEFGMNPKLIRSPYKKPSKKQKVVCLPRPQPLDLLNNDRSVLTFDEWGLLSNVIHAYDDQNLVMRTHCRFKEQSALPPKLRSKSNYTLELVGQFYTAMQPFIERTPHFQFAPSIVRRNIIQNNLNGIGSFNTILAAAEANVFDNETYVLMCNDIYGVEYMADSYRFLLRTEPNRTLLKLLLIVLAFSSNCSIVHYEQSPNSTNVPVEYLLQLIENQNVFVTMLWKYLLYQYGHIGAVRRFDHMIKNYLDTLTRMNENVSTQHWQMVDVIVEKTAHMLTLNG